MNERRREVSIRTINVVLTEKRKKREEKINFYVRVRLNQLCYWL